MQDENIKKMAEIDKPVETEQLYDIAIGTGVVNYFYYQDSVDYLLKNQLISQKKDSEGLDCYVIEPKGVACAKQLKTYAPKSYRDKLVLAALRYFARRKYEKEMKIEYIPAGKGYYTQIRVLDNSCDLMDLKLYAPDKAQAEIIGKNIMKNPLGFYSQVLELTLNNKEESFDPDKL